MNRLLSSTTWWWKCVAICTNCIWEWPRESNIVEEYLLHDLGTKFGWSDDISEEGGAGARDQAGFRCSYADCASR